ncbi:hypothetical protein HY251_09835, partial [bacterium]|nr:hypothetical protein [bacterium]
MARKAFGRGPVELLLGLVLALAAAGCSSGGGSSGGGASGTVSAGSTSGLSLGSGRAYHTATLLPSGDVLVAGGIDATGRAVNQTAIVSPSSGTVHDGPPLLMPRFHHTATLLENGQVLIVGGQQDVQSLPLFTSEIYDPVANTILPGPALGVARTQAVAVAFGPSGGEVVLVAGGSDGTSPLASVEVYDESKRVFGTLKAAMNEPHANAGAAVLDNGQVLIAGGDGAKGPAGAEIFDPTSGVFTKTTVTVKRTGAAFAATTHEAIMAGGQSSTGLERSTERYDETSQVFSQGSPLLTARRDGTASIISDAVVIVGGRSSLAPVSRVEILQGTTLANATVAATTSLTTARYAHTATAVASGHVIVIGGYDGSGNALASIEDVDPTTATPTKTVSSKPTAPPPSTAPPTAPPPPPPPPPATTDSSSSSGGLGGLLSGLLGGLTGGSSSSGSHGTIWGHLAKAFVDTLVTTGFSDGIWTFVKALFSNLISEFLGSGSGPPSGIGDLLSSLFGGGSSSSSSGSSGGIGGFLSSLFGGSSSSTSSGSSSGGIGGFLSGILGSLFGGGSSSSTS